VSSANSSVVYPTTPCNIPEELKLKQYRCENLQYFINDPVLTTVIYCHTKWRTTYCGWFLAIRS